MAADLVGSFEAHLQLNVMLAFFIPGIVYLADAVGITGAPAVDVSSGVEDRPGHKDPARIRAFLAAAKRL